MLFIKHFIQFYWPNQIFIFIIVLEKGYCMLGETCRFDHGRDPLEVDDRNLPQMLSLAASTFPPSTQPSSNAKIPNPAMTVFQNVNLLPGQRPMVPPLGANLSTSLTTVQMQNTRPSPVEMAPQVPIFRPRNPMALFRNISPSGGLNNLAAN